MKKKTALRLILAGAIIIEIIGIVAVILGMLWMANDRYFGAFPFIYGFASAYGAGELADAVERRL